MYTPRIAITYGAAEPEKRYANYVQCINEAGGEAVIALPGCNYDALLESVDGLLVPGGTDVDPACYGDASVSELLAPDAGRDELELTLVRAALARDLPLLAICRGHQVLNVACGGKLQQHIAGDGHRAFAEPPYASRFHTVNVEEGSVLADLLGSGVIEVNSRHHQAVRLEHLGEGLLPAAMSPDGIVEALESPAHRFVLSVQWHPERPEVVERSRPLFSALIESARGAGVTVG
jgi:gamma-glutamyl-gamma-aminobutyrate hydrolase PuuD